MLHAIILICAAFTATCDRNSATDVMVTPVYSAMPVTCGLQGQAFLAQMELGRSLRDGERVVVVCERSVK